MKISTKIISGYGILISLMVGLLAHQVFTIHRMQSVTTRLSKVNFDVAYRALRLKNDIAPVEEFTRKSFASDDTDYPAILREYRTLFETRLLEFEDTELSPEEQEEIQRLARFWRAFSEELERQQLQRSPHQAELPAILEEHIERLKTQTETVRNATESTIEKTVQESGETARAAQTVTWIVASIALVLGGLVSLFIVQSISAPLKQLTQGTRAIAEGKFFYRLDTTRHDEFAQLAKDFNTMTHRLNELDQMKRDFISHASHELKAPLASMQETIQLLLEQIPGPLNEKQKRLLELNLESGQRLSAMIGNLLDLSRMEAGVIQYELKSNDLAALTCAAAADLLTQAAKRDLELTVDVPGKPLMVTCDGDRIMQIVRNLVGNAIKFSGKGSAIRVRVSTVKEIPAGLPPNWRDKILTPPDGQECSLLTVTDFGPGVPDFHKEKIFEKFHQVKQGKKVPGQGVGLGLAICRTIVEAHHGAIWIEDNPEGGSVFHVLIPPGDGGDEVTYRASSPI